MSGRVQSSCLIGLAASWVYPRSGVHNKAFKEHQRKGPEIGNNAAFKEHHQRKWLEMGKQKYIVATIGDEDTTCDAN
jgi:hypothetical protein